MAGMQTKPMQTKPMAQPTKAPGAMIEKARGMAVGGSMQQPGKPAMQAKPMVRPMPMKPDVIDMPTRKAPLTRDPGIGNYQSPPIFAGGQQPGWSGGGLQIMDGGAMVPGTMSSTGGSVGAGGNSPGGWQDPGAVMPGGAHENPNMAGSGGGISDMVGRPGQGAGPNMAGGGLNPAASGLPPGMQLPPHLQAAVQNGMDPQAAFDRAMQNRAGFRDKVMAQQQGGASPNQPGGAPPGSPQVRNLSDVYRGGSTGGFNRAAAQQQDRARFLAGQQGGGQLPVKPMPGGPGGPGGVHTMPGPQFNPDGGGRGMQFQRPFNGYEY